MHDLDEARRRAANIRSRVYAARPLPLVDFDVAEIYSVVDYGARPGTGDNALPAIRATIAAAQASGKAAKVLFSEGRFDLYPDFEGADHCLRIMGAEQMILDGNGAELVIHNPLAGFLELLGCHGVVVRNFEVDYAPLPFTQGTIQDVHASSGTVDLLIDPGYSTFDEPHWALLKPNMNWLDCASWGMLKDRERPGRLKPACPNAYFAERFERLGDRLYRIAIKPRESLRFFEPGDRYVHQSRPEAIEGTFVNVRGSHGVTFLNMLSYASPSWSYVGWGSSWLGFINCAVRRKEGRWHTLDSDGINTGGGRIGPWIEGCHFEAGADDVLVSHAYPSPVEHVVDERTAVLSSAGLWSIERGDPFVFYNPRDGIPLGQAVVERIDVGRRAVLFDRPLPALHLEGHFALDDQAYNLNNANGNFVMRANTVRDNRRWPVWISTPAIVGGIVENNVFEGVDSEAINVFKDVGWDVPRELIEAYASKPVANLPGGTDAGYDLGHLLIADNRIRDCAFNSFGPAIRFEHQCLGGRISPWRAIGDVVLLGNEITNWCGKHALGLSNVHDVLAYGNTVTQDNNRYERRPVSIVHVARAGGSRFAGNAFDDPMDIPTFSGDPAAIAD